MTDQAKPSPESGTEAQLPLQVESAIQAYANAVLFHEDVTEKRAALVARLIEWGAEREHTGYERAASLMVPP